MLVFRTSLGLYFGFVFRHFITTIKKTVKQSRSCCLYLSYTFVLKRNVKYTKFLRFPASVFKKKIKNLFFSPKKSFFLTHFFNLSH
jgi:hypothetical protein